MTSVRTIANTSKEDEKGHRHSDLLPDDTCSLPLNSFRCLSLIAEALRLFVVSMSWLSFGFMWLDLVPEKYPNVGSS